ncbi:phenylacetate--CoA ligase family protein [Flavobacterium sp. LM5]|uniref:phenylacetate--CoA ligase family protein n=1 Tax=Flavobacterium sp. LM5 TaxID=1938610 RepID=UPI00111778AF|nr:phenylacetate--CoA ligase family protein [Flavobacterium sp. LM5]
MRKKLTELLTKASNDTLFYKDFNDKRSLVSFPIMTKATLIQNSSGLRSKSFPDATTVRVHTSGSYGMPATFYLSKRKKRRQWAEVLYYGAHCGYQVGTAHAYFRSNPPKSKLRFFIQNEYFFASKILDDCFAAQAVQQLSRKKIKILIGFPSAIAYLATYCLQQERSPSDFAIEGIISCSENLTNRHRAVIEKAFGVPVHNRYSTEELGVLGYQYEREGVFQLNTAHYIFEVLQMESDASVAVGEVGRVVVTDLHSEAMPLIRYETGDLAVLEAVFDFEPTWARQLKAFSGRSVQLLRSVEGKPLYPLYFDTLMDAFPFFEQYQLIQESETTFTIVLVPNFAFEKEKFVTSSFLQPFKNWLGAEALITIRFQSDIQKLPSGKRPYVINRLKTTL